MAKLKSLTFGRYDYAAFLTFFTYAAGSVIVPVVLVSLARELGFGLEEGGLSLGGLLHLGRSTPMMLSMALCGFAAGRWGKRRTFGWSILLMGVGMALCAVSPTYGILFLSLMIAGLGEGIIEGLATPFVQDLHSDDEPGRYNNFTHGFWSVGVLVTVLVSGLLLWLGVWWRVLIGAVAILSIVPALLILVRPGAGKQHYPDHPEPLDWKTVRGHMIEIVRIPRFWIFFAAMFFAGGGEFAFTFWTAAYIQLELTPAAWAGGAGTAMFAAGMVAGRTGYGYIIRQEHLKQLILYSAVGGTAVTLFCPAVQSLWLFFLMLFLAGVATAPFWPSIQSYCADCLPDKDTTMLFILLACAGIPGCGFFAWLMGVIGNEAGGLGNAFYVVPGCYAVLALLIGWASRKHGGMAVQAKKELAGAKA